MSTVLVTGGSGFVAVHTILQLLVAGHRVRTTVRNPDRSQDVPAMLREGGAPSVDQLSFFTADLEADAGWQHSRDDQSCGQRRTVHRCRRRDDVDA